MPVFVFLNKIQLLKYEAKRADPEICPHCLLNSELPIEFNSA